MMFEITEKDIKGVLRTTVSNCHHEYYIHNIRWNDIDWLLYSTQLEFDFRSHTGSL